MLKQGALNTTIASYINDKVTKPTDSTKLLKGKWKLSSVAVATNITLKVANKQVKLGFKGISTDIRDVRKSHVNTFAHGSSEQALSLLCKDDLSQRDIDTFLNLIKVDEKAILQNSILKNTENYKNKATIEKLIDYGKVKQLFDKDYGFILKTLIDRIENPQQIKNMYRIITSIQENRTIKDLDLLNKLTKKLDTKVKNHVSVMLKASKNNTKDLALSNASNMHAVVSLCKEKGIKIPTSKVGKFFIESFKLWGTTLDALNVAHQTIKKDEKSLAKIDNELASLKYFKDDVLLSFFDPKDNKNNIEVVQIFKLHFRIKSNLEEFRNKVQQGIQSKLATKTITSVAKSGKKKMAPQPPTVTNAQEKLQLQPQVQNYKPAKRGGDTLEDALNNEILRRQQKKDNQVHLNLPETKPDIKTQEKPRDLIEEMKQSKKFRQLGQATQDNDDEGNALTSGAKLPQTKVVTKAGKPPSEANAQEKLQSMQPQVQNDKPAKGVGLDLKDQLQIQKRNLKTDNSSRSNLQETKPDIKTQEKPRDLIEPLQQSKMFRQRQQATQGNDDKGNTLTLGNNQNTGSSKV